jgi:hypothetical protein
MFEIGEHELKVMNCLLHPESIETAVTESGLPQKVVLDIIRNLVHYRYIKPTDADGKVVNMFSPDKLRAVRFVLSAKGISALNPKP